MQPNTANTWLEWIGDNAAASDDEKLAALRGFIVETASVQINSGEITSNWANKKLARLGITHRFDIVNTYILEAPVTGTVRISVRGRNRSEAVQAFDELLANATNVSITAGTPVSAPTFAGGPEDLPQAVDPDAPATVDDTLTVLREILLLGNVAGPRWNCDTGVNRVLASYGLPLLPARQTFKVRRPVTGTVATEVDAYDEATALRVAGWRWDDGHKGFTLDDSSPTGDMEIIPAAS